ncbi:hypothetical protein Ddye_028383 [Dipteronia dyeriana]|uniref:Pentatricopeptide repeat-containing protein n=1 Tax=Dipteronia dyeriana TaxID=168575 RepID=A0AAD9TRE4_9ROSI|nr:hypothetical protein Ddye_028383 [Dipteronia dyeriana]
MASFNIQPNRITYTVMIDGHCKLGNMKEAATLLHEMAKKGIVPDDITYNVFMNRNCKEGNMEDVVEYAIKCQVCLQNTSRFQRIKGGCFHFFDTEKSESTFRIIIVGASGPKGDLAKTTILLEETCGTN